MKIGYSFWGFLGNGITDTPDGGRSHRRPFIDALLAQGHEITFLQGDRDRLEAGDDLGAAYRFDTGLPEIDVLFLEWRWPIVGRNTTVCGTSGHACDLHRQAELLKHYTQGRRTPTLVWDKDRTLLPDEPLRRMPWVAVCEAAFDPSPGAHRLLFPVADHVLDHADPLALARRPRTFALGYVGNQYDRDDQFDRYFAPAAARFPHQVAGKWTRTDRWPHVAFRGRVPFAQAHQLYSDSLATVLLLPGRYRAVGQVTQRIFEAVLAGCFPLAPADISHVDRFVPRELVIKTGDEAVQRLSELEQMAGSDGHADMIADCLDHLDLFRLSRQVDAVEAVLSALTEPRRTQRGAA